MGDQAVSFESIASEISMSMTLGQFGLTCVIALKNKYRLFGIKDYVGFHFLKVVTVDPLTSGVG